MDFDRLTKAMGDLNEREVMSIVSEIMADGGRDAIQSLLAFQEGMNIVSERYDACEYFVGDLIFAGELMTQAVNIMRLALSTNKGENGKIGEVIICTVDGDLHDIGKNIVKTVMESRGIGVIDLGVSVPPGVIVENAIQKKIKVIALSGVLHYALVSMQRASEAFQEAGIRDQVKIIVGGACINADTFKATGADSWSNNPSESVDICCRWLQN